MSLPTLGPRARLGLLAALGTLILTTLAGTLVVRRGYLRSRKP